MAEDQVEVAPVAVDKPVEKVKAVKKKTTAKAKKPSVHPKYAEMVREALATLKERGGSSRQAILKYIAQNYKLATEEKMVNAHLKMALKSGVKNGTLKQSKGIGASGSFKLGDDKEVKEGSKGTRSPAKDRADATKKAVKPKAKSAAKTKKTKVSAITKSPEKKTAIKAKSPKKEIKKPAAKPKAKAVASPKAVKKTAKPAAKSKKASPAKAKK